MINIDNKTYFTGSEVRRFLHYLRIVLPSFMLIPYKDYKTILSKYNPSIKVNFHNYYNLNFILNFIEDMNFKTYKSFNKLEHIGSAFVNFKDTLISKGVKAWQDLK